MANTDPESSTAQWSRLRRDVGVVLWSSFLAACIATMLFFAYFDPESLTHDGSTPAWLSDRMTAYAVGFFFFWFIAAVCGTLVAWMLDASAMTSTDRSTLDNTP